MLSHKNGRLPRGTVSPRARPLSGEALICFSGSDRSFELSRMLAAVFQEHGLTALALAYVMEEDLPTQFYRVPIDPLERAAKRLHEMGYEKVGLWGISKGAELALTAGNLLPGLSKRDGPVQPDAVLCAFEAADYVHAGRCLPAGVHQRLDEREYAAMELAP